MVLPPPGFEFAEQSFAVRTRHRPEDMHVNGDILQRLLDRGSADRLRQLLTLEAQRADDPMSMWIKDNLETMLSEVDTLIEEIRAVSDRWF